MHIYFPLIYKLISILVTSDMAAANDNLSVTWNELGKGLEKIYANLEPVNTKQYMELYS